MDTNLHDMVPCEICDILIPSNQYMQHINTSHFMPLTTIRNSRINFIRQNFSSNIDGGIGDERERESDSESSEVEYQSFSDVFLQENDNNHLFQHIIDNIFPLSSLNITLINSRAHENEYEFNTQLEEYMGKVIRGIDDLTQVTHEVFQNKDSNGGTCPICIETYQKNSILRKLKCNHIFCDECIKTWLSQSKKCPICKIDLEDEWVENNKI